MHVLFYLLINMPCSNLYLYNIPDSFDFYSIFTNMYSFVHKMLFQNYLFFFFVFF